MLSSANGCGDSALSLSRVSASLFQRLYSNDIRVSFLALFYLDPRRLSYWAFSLFCIWLGTW